MYISCKFHFFLELLKVRTIPNIKQRFSEFRSFTSEFISYTIHYSAAYRMERKLSPISGEDHRF